MKAESTWTIYRSRFVVRARQLTECLVFTDALGREHSGQPGDYLVESLEGLRCIRPRHNSRASTCPCKNLPADLSCRLQACRDADVLTPQTLPTRLPPPLDRIKEFATGKN